MRKLIFMTVLLAWMATISAANVSQSFYPTPIDLSDLPHANYFTWGINFTLPQNEQITKAVLTYYNIYDWTNETGDHLYTHLLDSPAFGVVAYKDSQGGGDNFAGQGTWIGDWTDDYGGSPRGFSLIYEFDQSELAELNAYALTSATGKANFGFGIDSDCHYYNRKVEFCIETTTLPATTAVPVPGAILLGGIGVCLVGWLRRRRTL